MRALVPSALLLLAACGQTSTQTGQDPKSGEGKDEPAPPTVQQGQPENLMDDPRNEAVPVEPPLPTPTNPPGPLAPPTPAVKRSADAMPVAGPVSLTPKVPVPTIPAAFRGRWGMTPADCEPGRADAKGLMEVGPKSLGFYESRGLATEVAAAAPDRIEAKLAFTGEGQSWTSTQTLALGRGGRTLTREERDPPGSFRYAKCPA